MFVDPNRSRKNAASSAHSFSWASSFEGKRNSVGRLARIAVDHLPHGLLVFGKPGVVVDANCQAEAVFGYSRGELIGVPVSSFLPEHSAGGSAERQTDFLETLRHQMGSVGRVRGVRKDGSIVLLAIELSTFVDADSRYVVASVVEATKRQEAVSPRTAGESQSFARLIADLSTRLGKVEPDALDDAIVEALREVGQSLQQDQAILWRKDLAEGVVVPTHYWVQPPCSFVPESLPLGSIPALLDMLEAGDVCGYESPAGLPGAADRDTLERAGLLSGLVVPFTLNGDTNDSLSALILGSNTPGWAAAPEVVDSLRLVAATLAQAFSRLAAHAALEKANQEIRQLRDRLTTETVELRREVKVLRSASPIISESDAIQRTLAQIEQVAHTPATVLLMGETGTGKEVMAQAIHNMSPRHQRQMVRVSCAAIPTALIESELFGRERGAYTGALSRQIGRFEAANQSTLFLDEIGELPGEVQVKLLRVLQERVIERLGSTQSIKVDVRIIAATNRNLEQAVADKTFREDLFYRLNVFPVVVPPLRERVEDIPGLVWSFIDEFSRLFGKDIDSISKDSLRELQRYPWPGNVRELRNVIERAVIITTSKQLVVPAPRLTASRTVPRLNMTLTDLEIEHIRGVLESTNWRVRGPGGAAERLGLKPTTLESRMARLGIERKKAS